MATYIRKLFGSPVRYMLTACGCCSALFLFKSTPVLFPNYLHRPLSISHGCELQLSQLQEFQSVCQDLDVSPRGYILFTNKSPYITFSGLPWLPNGVAFGIPRILTSDPDVGKWNYSFSSKLDTEHGKLFKDSLILSEDARKFALAREVIKVESNYEAYDVILGTFQLVLTFGASFVLFITTRLLALPYMTIAVWLFVYPFYRVILSQLREIYDFNADKMVCKLSDNYARGGLEFYDKTLQRNRALRVLLGKEGEKLYTFYGNHEQDLFSSKGASLVARRDRVKKAVAEISQTMQSS